MPCCVIREFERPNKFQLGALKHRIQELETALRPLARVADFVRESRSMPDSVGIWSHETNIPGHDNFTLTLGDARRAAKTLVS